MSIIQTTAVRPEDMHAGDIWLDDHDDYNLILKDPYMNKYGELVVEHMDLKDGHIYTETWFYWDNNEEDGPFFVEKAA